MPNENTQNGLTIEQAVSQLSKSRQQAPEEEHLEDVTEEVVDESEEAEVEVDSDEDAVEEDDLEEDEEEGDDQDSEESEEETEDGDEEVFLVPDGEGNEVEVTSEELVKGYLRQNDYTRKRQADAKAVKDLTSKYEERLTQLDEALQSNVSFEQQQMQQISAQMQKETDEVARQNLHYRYLQLQQSLQSRTSQQKQLAQLKQAREAAAQEAKVKQEMAALAETFEDWDTRKDVLAGYLKDQGFSDLSPFVNHNMAILVDKAKKFDDLQQTRETVVKKKLKKKVPKTLKPGTGEKKVVQDRQKINAQASRFQKTGSITDAIDLLQARRGNS